MGLCCSTNRTRGNIIFRPLEINIEKTGNENLDKIFDEAKKILIDAETLRKDIADRFKIMITETGSVILKRPDLDSSLIGFILKIMVDINHNVKEGESLIDYRIFKFQTKSPFIVLNQERIEEVKKKTGFDPQTNKQFITMKDSILHFLEIVTDKNYFYEKLKTEVKRLEEDAKNFLTEIKREFESEGKDHITLSQAYEYIKVAEKNAEHILSLHGMLGLINELFKEVAIAAEDLVEKIEHPGTLIRWEAYAKDCVERNISDVKEVAWNYFQNEDKLLHLEDWKTNYFYKEDENEVTLK